MGYLITPTSSGIYTPNVLNETGACSSSLFTSAYFLQVGNIINVSIYGSTTVDFSTNTTGEIDFDFPFNQTLPNAIGTVSIDKPLLIQGIVLSKTITFTSTNILIIGQSLDFTVTFQYLIN
jgi:hypothetical protein